MAATRSLSTSPDVQNRADSHPHTPPISPLSKPATAAEEDIPQIEAFPHNIHLPHKPRIMLKQPFVPQTTTMHTSPAIALDIDQQRASSPGLWNAPGTENHATPLHPLQHRDHRPSSSASKSGSYRDTFNWKQPNIADMANPQIVIRRVTRADGSEEEVHSRPESSRGQGSDTEENTLDVPANGLHRVGSHGDHDLHSIEEGDIVGTIDLAPCPSTWLVGFEDRPNDMKRVMELPQNRPIFEEIKNRVGADAYDHQLVPLWTQTPRESMGDIHWLVKSRRVILPDLDVPEYFKFIWRRFAGVVGWEGNDKDLDIGRRASTRQNSTASFTSNSSRRLDSYWE